LKIYLLLVLWLVPHHPPLSELVLPFTKVDVPGPNLVIFNMGPDTKPIRKTKDLQRTRSFENNLWQVDASHSPHVAKDVAVESKVSGEQRIEFLEKIKVLTNTFNAG
jgi:hypothetical protein